MTKHLGPGMQGQSYPLARTFLSHLAALLTLT